MIFKKLSLKNFMSYSNAEIDFSGIHVACLLGPNGAGKSSLLDAITWTIWEEGRARTDELIKLGQNEMSCQVEFLMEESLYRVYRSRSRAFRNSQGKSNLEFQIFNPKEENWKSLSMSSTRQTQELIIKTLKMDHNTFVNSVYLRQGKADEFTIKRPNERKQILSDILGLEMYDNLCDAARSKVKSLEQSILLEQNLISNLNEKIKKEEELKEKLNIISYELKEKEKNYNKVKNSLNIKEKELNEKKEKERQIYTLEKARENQESLIKTLEGQFNNIKAKEEKFNELINNKIQIEKDYKEFLKLKNESENIEVLKDKYNKLNEEKSFLELELRDKIKQSEQELAVYKSKLNEKNKLKKDLNEKIKNESKFTDFLEAAKKEIKSYGELQESLKKIETEGLELKHKKELLEFNIKKLDEKKDEILKKIKILNEHNHFEPCPLCKSPIKDRKKVIEHYNAELENINNNNPERELITCENNIQNKRKEYNELKEKINNYGKYIVNSLKELQEIKQEKIEIQPSVSFFESQLEITKTEFQKAKEQILTLEKEITTYSGEINLLNNLIKGGTVVKEISEKLSNILNQIKEINYDPERYEYLKKNIKVSESIVSTYNSLIQAESEILLLNKESKNLSLKITQSKGELEKLELLIGENKKQIKDIVDLIKEVELLKEEELEEANLFSELKKEFIVQERVLNEISEIKTISKEKENKIQKLIEDKKYLEILEKAFSKNGIQVAIIETVVPEIEKEANRILNRLTENQMHIALRTQREKKSQEGLQETLDVVIADNLGTRNYELYSGGEAFKIDFALRLALSRFLTNRSGAKLKTLIIDEGFGSQDSSGKERLVEVIRSIESEFELILVVTHMDELKECFPAQIQVTKDEEGSKVQLIA